MSEPTCPRGETQEIPVCTPVALPPDLLLLAAAEARSLDPRNDPWSGYPAQALGAPDLLASKGALSEMDPLALAVLTNNYWGPEGKTLTTGFLDSPNAATRRLILQALNEWSRYGNLQFVEAADPIIRIARSERNAYWSHVGPQNLQVPRGQATMMLSGVTEHFRDWYIVTHEGGHAAGLQHEQLRREIVQRINRQAAYDLFWQTARWSRQMVDQNVLNPLPEGLVRGSSVTDVHSVMCYSLPGSIMLDGIAVPGGKTISAIDQRFFGELYPLTAPPPPPPPVTGAITCTIHLDAREIVVVRPEGWTVR